MTHRIPSWRNVLRRSIYMALLARLGLVMLLYSACRVVFFLYHRDFFHDTTYGELVIMLFGGLRFDLSAVLYINLLYIQLWIIPFRFRHNPIYQQVAMWLFLVTNSFALALNCADFVRFPFIHRRTTAAVIEEFAHEGNLPSLIAGFVVDYWSLLLFWIALVAFLIWTYRSVTITKGPGRLRSRVYYIRATILFLVINVFVIVGMRGGFFGRSHRPITNSNAGAYVTRPHEMAIVLNTPFSIIRSFSKQPFRKRHDFINEDELEAVYTPHHQARFDAVQRNVNVVLVILESFSREFFGKLNPHRPQDEYQGYTPFLESLMDESLVYTNAFANGKKSIDGLPVVTASIPAMIEPFILSHHYNNRIETIASLLERRGYRTAFFHGAPNGSMGFEAFVTVAGYDAYYGMNEYGNDDDYDGVWGIWDEEFFQYTANTLDTLEQPFLATLVSVSSHHPWLIPEKHAGKFKQGPIPMYESVGYTDYALKRFFETAAQKPWFDNTLFVITADHASPHLARSEYKTLFGRFRIPLIFYRPNNLDLIGTDNGVAQQIDILPTILHYVGFNDAFIAFGNDLFDVQSNRFAINYSGGTFQLVHGEYVLQFDGEVPIALYKYGTDIYQKENLIDSEPEKRDSMTQLIKAILQQYNNRMIDDRLALRTGRWNP